MTQEQWERRQYRKDKAPSTNFFLWIMVAGVVIAILTGGGHA